MLYCGILLLDQMVSYCGCYTVLGVVVFHVYVDKIVTSTSDINYIHLVYHMRMHILYYNIGPYDLKAN